MRRVWTRRIALVNLANVPPQGAEAARVNMETALDLEPAVAAISEAWGDEERRGVQRACTFNGYVAFGPEDNSTMLAHRPTALVLDEILEPVLLHGRVAGKFGLVSDRRLMTVARYKIGVRKVIVGSVHLAPPGTRKGRAAVLAATAARAIARRRLRRFVTRTGYPVILAGDWNSTGLHLGSSIDGRAVRYSNPRRIDHVVTIDGHNVTLSPSTGSTFKLPHSDHRGAIVTVAAYES